jgi:molybdenum cofactor cytidylyltransferase
MSDTPPGIGLVLLAAGGSARLGTIKQLLVFQGRTLLRHAAEEAAASGCHPVVVVLGAYADWLARELVDLPVLVAYNAAWRTGMGSSIRTGVGALIGAETAVEGVVITVCDQPLCDASVIRRLVEGHACGVRRIVSASYAGVCGVPTLFDGRLFPQLLALDGQQGAQRILEAHGDEVFPIPFTAGAVDVDTPEDFERLKALSPGRPKRWGQPPTTTRSCAL